MNWTLSNHLVKRVKEQGEVRKLPTDRAPARRIAFVMLPERRRMDPPTGLALCDAQTIWVELDPRARVSRAQLGQRGVCAPHGRRGSGGFV